MLSYNSVFNFPQCGGAGVCRFAAGHGREVSLRRWRTMGCGGGAAADTCHSGTCPFGTLATGAFRIPGMKCSLFLMVHENGLFFDFLSLSDFTLPGEFYWHCLMSIFFFFFLDFFSCCFFLIVDCVMIAYCSGGLCLSSTATSHSCNR